MRVYCADGRNIFLALSDHLYLLTVGVDVIVAPDQTHTIGRSPLDGGSVRPRDF
jgi:hypothetical protein